MDALPKVGRAGGRRGSDIEYHTRGGNFRIFSERITRSMGRF